MIELRRSAYVIRKRQGFTGRRFSTLALLNLLTVLRTYFEGFGETFVLVLSKLLSSRPPETGKDR